MTYPSPSVARSRNKFGSWAAAFSIALLLAAPARAQEEDYDTDYEEEAPRQTPEQVLAAAPADHWLAIPVSDLMIFTLPDAEDGTKRQAAIQLLPANLSGGHVRNVRTFAKKRWWDGTKIYRVAKDFVTQFGGNPLAKKLPGGLETVPESEYFSAALGIKRKAESDALKAAVDYSNQYQDTEIRPLICLLYTSPSPRDKRQSRMPSSA